MRTLPLAAFVFLLSSTLLILSSSEEMVRTLTLEQAVCASKGYPLLLAADQTVQAAKAFEGVARAGYFPQVTLRGETTHSSRSKIGTTDRFATTAGHFKAEVRQQLLSAQGPLQKSYHAKLVTDQTRLQKDALYDQHRAEVEQTFIRTWLLQQQCMVMRQLARASNQKRSRKQEEYEVELLNQADLYSAEATYQADHATVASYTAELLSSTALLEQLTGLSLSCGLNVARLSWSPNRTLSLLPLKHYLALAKRYRKDLLAKSSEGKALHYQAKLAGRTTIPRLDLITSYDYEKSDYYVANESHSYFTGVGASWQLFDGNAGLCEADRLRALAIKTEYERDALKRKVETQIRQLYHKIQAELITRRARTAQATAAYGYYQRSRYAKELGLTTLDEYEKARHTVRLEYFKQLESLTRLYELTLQLHATCGYPEELCLTKDESCSENSEQDPSV